VSAVIAQFARHVGVAA